MKNCHYLIKQSLVIFLFLFLLLPFWNELLFFYCICFISNTITFCFSWRASSMPVMLWNVLPKKRTAVSTKALLHPKLILFFFNHPSTVLPPTDFNLNALLHCSQNMLSVHPSWSKICKCLKDKGVMKCIFKNTYSFLLKRSLHSFFLRA